MLFAGRFVVLGPQQKCKLDSVCSSSVVCSSSQNTTEGLPCVPRQVSTKIQMPRPIVCSRADDLQNRCAMRLVQCRDFQERFYRCSNDLSMHLRQLLLALPFRYFGP